MTGAFDPRPLVVALAGPNGAGKSTFYRARLRESLGLTFVNADVIAKAHELDAYGAADVADRIRRELVGMRESFIFETVFSDPVGEKVRFLRETVEAGYQVVLVFIGIEDAQASDERVAMRVLQGGHDVPTEKLEQRYPRTLRNLTRALHDPPNVIVYDNSDLTRPYREVLRILDGKLEHAGKPLPEWLVLPEPLRTANAP